jgi:UDP-2-acetamido-3-amino-2,3-dideoxy-glucuronate N-acetyltransferase
MHFPNGINAHIFVSWLNPFKEQKFVVIGDRKMAVFDDVSEHRYKLRLYPHQIRWRKGIIPVAERADFELVQFPEKEPLEEECRHFLHCVIERKQPLTDGEEALKVLEVLTMCTKLLSTS